MIHKTFELSSLFHVEKAKEDTEELLIQGTANATTKDRVGDVIAQEAWAKGGLDNYGKNPIILAFHNHSKPIGTATEMKADINGLHIKAKISKAAGDVYQLIKDGVLKAFSVGFIVKDADYDPKTDIFKITDLELLEVSVVSVPANQDSLFSLAKSFDSEDEFLEFKKSFISTDTPEEKIEKSVKPESDKAKGNNMDPKEIEKLIKDAAEKAALQAAEATTKAAEEAKKAAETQASQKAEIEVLKSGTEKLLDDIKAQAEASEKGFKEALDNLRAEVNEKADEIKALRDSKMSFQDKKSGEVAYKDLETAVLLAKATGKKLQETKAWDNIVVKYGEHVPSADWENRVSTNMQDEIRQRLVMAPLFTGITMPGPVVKLPVNPEAGYATWVNPTAYKAVGSSGNEATHVLKEITISAYKLATKEFLGNEEEDDAILALLPIVRDAMVRRTAKSWDLALLRGTGATAADPIKGLAAYEASTANTTLTTTSKATVATLAAMRRKLGVWGLDPSEVVYVVSSDVYFDLLDDTNFQTMDKVGSNATILTGEIGRANGSSVIVSGEFAAKAGGTAGSIGAVAFNKRNFMTGDYKSLRVESDYLVEEQMRILVASLRTAFQQISTVDGHAVSALRWT